jgi:hypothetical protein
MGRCDSNALGATLAALVSRHPTTGDLAFEWVSHDGGVWFETEVFDRCFLSLRDPPIALRWVGHPHGWVGEPAPSIALLGGTLSVIGRKPIWLRQILWSLESLAYE